MKKIIEHGLRRKIVRRFVCTHCECVFDADEDEFKREIDTHNESYCISECPECGHVAYSPDQV